MARWQRVGRTLILVGVLAAGSIGVAVAQVQTAPAVAVIKKFQGTLLSVMKSAKTLGFAGRYRQLKPAVNESHNLPFIAQLTMGPYWAHLTAAERSAFIGVFARMTIATYASEFNGYSPGQRFEVTASRVLGNGDVYVSTEFLSNKGRQASLDYVLALSGNKWKIVNIVANGVSDLALKQAQYTAIMGSEGLSTLMKKLRAKVAVLMGSH